MVALFCVSRWTTKTYSNRCFCMDAQSHLTIPQKGIANRQFGARCSVKLYPRGDHYPDRPSRSIETVDQTSRGSPPEARPFCYYIFGSRSTTGHQFHHLDPTLYRKVYLHNARDNYPHIYLFKMRDRIRGSSVNVISRYKVRDC